MLKEEDEVWESVFNPLKAVLNNAWDICINCNTQMASFKSELQCYTCGYNKKYNEQGSNYNENSVGGHNTPHSNSIGITITGRDAYQFKMCLQIYGGTNYKEISDFKTRKQLYKLNSHSSYKLPNVVIDLTAEYFSRYHEDTKEVKRGNGRLAVLAIFLLYACAKFDIAIKPKQLALWANVSQRHISRDSGHISNYMSSIGISPHINTTNSFINKYFEIFEIPECYKIVVSEIIEKSYDRKMINPENPNISTKVTSVIYLLKKLLNLKFTEKDIARECYISQSTFIKHYKNIVRNKKLMNPILLSYNMPLITVSKPKVKKLAVS
jgi:transcription initiation factor TFIIIB Brf1 subunit/transcription initiation factor TFIIB